MNAVMLLRLLLSKDFRLFNILYIYSTFPLRLSHFTSSHPPPPFPNESTPVSIVRHKFCFLTTPSPPPPRTAPTAPSLSLFLPPSLALVSIERFNEAVVKDVIDTTTHDGVGLEGGLRPQPRVLTLTGLSASTTHWTLCQATNTSSIEWSDSQGAAAALLVCSVQFQTAFVRSENLTIIRSAPSLNLFNFIILYIYIYFLLTLPLKHF